MNAPTCLAEGLPRRRFSVADVERMVEVGLISEDERPALGANAARRLRFRAGEGLYLSDTTYLEPDFIAFSREVRKVDVKGLDVLLAVEVADSSLGYDLGRKPRVCALHGVRELWVIDAVKRVLHLHRGLEGESYARVETRSSSERLVPSVAPMDFAFALDELEDI